MYDVLIGKQRGLIFPVMCNGHVRIDYSDNVPSTSDNLAYGIFDHTGNFTFEAILTPYDINGVGQYSATARPTVTATTKVMPSAIFSDASSADPQSNEYMPIANRLVHEMNIFSSTNFTIALVNATVHNENQPAEYKIKVDMSIGGVSNTFTTTSAVITANEDSMFKWGSSSDIDGFDINGRKTHDFLSSTTSHSGAVIGLSGSFENQCHAGQEVFIRDGFTFTSLGTIASVTGTTSITLNASYSPTLSNGTRVYIRSRKDASYINNTYHIACTLFENPNRICIYLNSKRVLNSTHANTGTFAFEKFDSYIGATGDGALGPNSAIVNKQFMGEMHELSIQGIPKNSFTNRETLLPSLLYLRFEEIDV